MSWMIIFSGDGRYGNPYTSGAVGSQYDYVHDEEDATFQLVDTSRPQRSNMQKSGRMRQQQQFYVNQLFSLILVFTYLRLFL